MSKIAIVTDSNSGITQNQAKELGVFVLPMPFFVEGKLHFEDIDLTQEQFYQLLESDADLSTSQPSPGDLMDLWEKVLKEYETLVYIPMSSALSASCETAMMLAKDYEGKVFVVNNRRISITQRQCVVEAKEMADQGATAEEIKAILEEDALEASIYLMVDTLKHLKKGGRITPAAAMIGSVLNLKPVLTIQGGKLDAFAKVRGVKQAKKVMLDAMKKDLDERFGSLRQNGQVVLQAAYSNMSAEAVNAWVTEIEATFPDFEVRVDPLSLSVACHTGPGVVAIACAKKSVFPK
ncbi:MAG: DegV family protein [Lachnospiraceae bacterium]|nr:DegV family protein [Lachnospiraceae bacterium]